MKMLERLVELIYSGSLTDQRILLQPSASFKPTTGYIQAFDYIPGIQKIKITVRVDQSEFNPPTRPATLDFAFESKHITNVDQDERTFCIVISNTIYCAISLPDPDMQYFAG